MTKSNKSNEGLSLLDSAKRILENSKFDSDKCQAAQSWIEEQLKRNPTPAPVHAEAGLMAYTMYIKDEWTARVSKAMFVL